MNVLPQIDVQPKAQNELWFKDAVIYQLHVKAFADSNNDGIGDFAGLTERLDYLQDLGVNTLWLLPFYPSPGRDDGYDIADYRRINRDFGTLRDFRRFMNEAHRRDLRVITELVINHTSDQHPWFKRARRSGPHTDARNWYVWSDNDQKYSGTRIIFSDTEKSNWSWDPQANAYYWHRFFSHQPDLNFDNPRVLWAVIQVMRRWLDMGVDGFRLDAIPYLCEREGTNNENLPETHAIIKQIRRELDSYAPGKLLLAEANQWPEDVAAYFGDGDECQMAYHFPLMPRIYMAIAQEDRFPIADILRQTPDIPANCQWALFLRNHDELTLEMVTDVERDYLWSTYANDPRARINLGIRRRLASLMDNDRRKIELMNSLLFSLPGTPIIYYGDEIGMGDNIYLGDRNGVRTPMQWTSDRNAGFSRCDPARLYLPVIMDAVYGHQSVNVEAQQRSPSSLLNWHKRLIGVRRSTQAFSRGSLTFVRPANRTVLGYIRSYENDTVLCVANLSRSAQSALFDLRPWKGRIPMEMLGRSTFPRIGDEPYAITLAPYGFFWFLLTDAPQETKPAPILREHTTLVWTAGWNSLLASRERNALENDVLPAFLRERRWFAEKAHGVEVAKLEALIPVERENLSAGLALVRVASSRGATSLYQVPLTLRWARPDRLDASMTPNVLAAIRRGPREGALVDAAADKDAITVLLTAVHDSHAIEEGRYRIEFTPTSVFKDAPQPTIEKATALNREQSNTTVIADRDYVVKVLRKVNEGIHPEIEMGRFLIEHTSFRNVPDLLGSVELVEGSARSALAVVHRFVENQGDAWTVTGAFLDRYIDDQRVLTAANAEEDMELTSYLQRIRQLGRRTGEFQTALASRPDVPDFAPEPIRPEDVSAWTERLVERSGHVLDLLTSKRASLEEAVTADVDRLLQVRPAIEAHIRSLLPGCANASKARHHGDFHLGQVLIVKDDAFILDLEGEPGRSLDERRQKVPAARDIAGMLRSIDYSTTAALANATNLTAEERAILKPKLDIWRQKATEEFWNACRQTADAALWPADATEARDLLEFFLLEKAFYEMEYELMNRPAWLHVPLEGTLRILAHHGVVQP
ncbi:maltose alpha-D-glucosyltransferase [Rhodoplanes sp. Z2-YC6860]|uniref:maltose alpha-D-glucosyltransferase n=1 Tax=Rhodoplanes sp. Z2-YC6860 TaxID=674703 RepID=UPI00078B44E7|nr:maltose alpha-D-glucosyltransferase [Rhodoplanes sp. Z2-YC6860]AMN43945.1 trehalose synthase [Rhodoplanes sp. Z2-YC6860]